MQPAGPNAPIDNPGERLRSYLEGVTDPLALSWHPGEKGGHVMLR
jgi:hypothetical protein